MNEDPLGEDLSSRSPHADVATPVGEIETAMADLRWALEEDDDVEKHYHVRSAMQRLQVLLDRAERSNPP